MDGQTVIGLIRQQDEVAVQIAQQALDALFDGKYRSVVNPAVLEKIGHKA